MYGPGHNTQTHKATIENKLAGVASKLRSSTLVHLLAAGRNSLSLVHQQLQQAMTSARQQLRALSFSVHAVRRERRESISCERQEEGREARVKEISFFRCCCWLESRTPVAESSSSSEIRRGKKPDSSTAARRTTYA